MSGLPGSSPVPLDLAMPGAQRSVQRWIGAPANSTAAPLRTVPAPSPVVVYAERKPRLSAPELLARHGGAPSPPPAGRPNLSVVPAAEVPPSARSMSAPRLLRWLATVALALAAVVLAPLS